MSIDVLREFTPRHEFFIGVDSDGCAIDQMNIKHYECFAPAYIKAFDLQPISTIARETAIFMNLHSGYRGINRWSGLALFFDLLKDRPEVARSGVRLPDGDALHAFVASGLPLSEAGLRQFMADHPDPELETCLEWGRIVNELASWMVHNTQPFPGVREAMARMAEVADTMVVSAASLAMLHHEWAEHDLAQYVEVIAGQEMGTKLEHLTAAAVGKYAPERILLLGDAPGDGRAAAAAGALWYPINPGHEAESWERLRTEALPKFLDGTFAGAYQEALIEDYSRLLPTTPPWPTMSSQE
ncbi:phosphoglycolate phosphatase-like HAD superfamily hydrolase [Arcanobacterium wilhelmae]|uniref:Phosphoglycolate phosphatase-like HAD superfamily hydrolase n=1 Tax=Arcanobacterium wilhelmae TaxID=1803177 RepID=A0ABT9NCA0_9ACTO|nr:hypothetical protein [Arcanobacterium wilhelmae]MDP9801337.1 phosphoglycolate phosphatase-like HAD superfamily hydrolase [Arcanobacterium wilhelmae]WFN90675.1 hypothetical protein P8A24_02120 [Arcanobacterium wilhelmae]